MSQKYIIYTHNFNIDSGGVIVLFQLCHILNMQGHDAKIWIEGTPFYNSQRPFKSISRIIKFYRRKYINRRPFITKVHKHFHTPIASAKDLKDAIVVYPEIVDGNPLNAKHIVRWLLHKPGFHTGRVNFTKNELLFGYGAECSGSGIEINEENILIVKYIMKDIYQQQNYGQRAGSCYMIRKAKEKPLIHDLNNSIQIDNLTHEEMNRIFNETEKFYSYDPYTYYSTYASLCGCISIVVPDLNVSKDEWHPNSKDTYGIAYGEEDIDYALQTRPLMLEYIQEQETRNYESVALFAKRCEEYFETYILNKYH